MPLRSYRFLKILEGNGFTLVELMIALVVSSVTVGAVYSVYTVQQRHFRNQQLVLTAQQNLRGALMVIEQELRMLGYDPEDSGGFGLVDVRRYNVNHAGELNIDGQPVLFYTYDLDEDGGLDKSAKGRNKEHPKFRISDVHNDGRICLTWDNGSGRRPLAENIQAIAFAYAVDVDADGYCDRWAGGPHLIWAVDSNNDNLLDTHIDTNSDGVIDEKDDANGDNRIDMADGCALNPQVHLDRVKAVRVWVLAATTRPLQGSRDSRKQVVGDRIFVPPDDGLKRLVLQTRVQFRNL